MRQTLKKRRDFIKRHFAVLICLLIVFSLSVCVTIRAANSHAIQVLASAAGALPRGPPGEKDPAQGSSERQSLPQRAQSVCSSCGFLLQVLQYLVLFLEPQLLGSGACAGDPQFHCLKVCFLGLMVPKSLKT